MSKIDNNLSSVNYRPVIDLLGESLTFEDIREWLNNPLRGIDAGEQRRAALKADAQKYALPKQDKDKKKPRRLLKRKRKQEEKPYESPKLQNSPIAVTSVVGNNVILPVYPTPKSQILSPPHWMIYVDQFGNEITDPTYLYNPGIIGTVKHPTEPQ